MSLADPGSIITDSGRTFFATDTEEVIDVVDSASDARVEVKDGAIEVRALDTEGAQAVVACASPVVVAGGASDGEGLLSSCFANKG